MEKLEQNKVLSDAKIKELSVSCKQKETDLETLSQELISFKNSFKSVSTVLLPDVRQLTDNIKDREQINEITTNSISIMLEKVLLCHKKQEEMLRFQIQNLESKIKDLDKASGEKLNYEIKLLEIQDQEEKNGLLTIIETKDQEISLLKTEKKKVESKLHNFQKKFKEEMMKYKKNLEESKHLTEMRYKEIFDGKEKVLEESVRIQNENDIISLENKDLKNEIKSLKEKFEEQVQSSSNCLSQSMTNQKENHNLKNKLIELNTLLEKCKLESKSSIINIENQLKKKENECAIMESNMIDLNDKLKSIPMEVEIKIREEEKIQYHKEMDTLNELIKNHKSIIENANLELQQKEKTIDNFFNKVEILEKDIVTLETTNHSLKDECNQLQTILTQRDSRIIDLQLKVTELKEKLKAHGEQVSHNFKALENAQQMNLSFQSKITSSEKDKANLEHSNHTLKQQNESLQEEANQLLNVLNIKDSEIDTIKKERKLIAKKLKEKNDALIFHQQKYEMNSQTIDNLQASNTELQNACKDLMNKNTNLSKAINILEDEKCSLEIVSAEQEGVKDREINNLLNRLSGSEADLLKLKKVLKRIKMKDSSSKYE